ncbi:hypothetical protein ACIQF6_05355 [Kitasatospora sp. NPDC092948]|uniref:hypothetical protein n=1 Tax=Kitasatospora sp. NPDC092948 TaxID=3364088 RepID=UPI0037FF2D7D
MTTPEPNNPYAPPPQAPSDQAPQAAPYGQAPQQTAYTPADQAPGAQAAAPQTPAWGAGAPGGVPVGVPLAGAHAGPKNVPVAILAGLGVALAVGLLYGFIVKAIDHEISWMVIGIAAAVGLTLGKIGGKHPVLPPLGSVLAVLGLFFGEMFGLALIVHEQAGVDVTAVFTDHFDLLFEAWKETFDLMSALFIAIGVFMGFSLTTKFGNS